jgi:thiol-disulfide isomerase/thioredoxin
MLAPALLALLTSAPTTTLPWIADDWAAAKKAAVTANKLVAVDVWATWCHTCLSMKNYTLEEKPLARVAAQHVWLALDYDRESNAAFFGTFPVSAFPTFLVVDPVSEQVVARWVGSGTAEQMAAFFAAAQREARDPITLGARALAKDDAAGARKIYEAALTDKALDRAQRTRLYNGLMEALSRTDPAACAARAAEVIAQTDDTAPGIDAVLIGADCASSAAPAVKTAVEAAARERLARVAASPALAALAPDDQSGLLSTLASLYDEAGQPKKGDEVTAQRRAVLERAAQGAKTPAQRATFDAHRLECYLRLKAYDVAEQMLSASERDFPRDFNPPARLALLYRDQGDTTRGLAAIERALSRGYGPRKVRLHTTKIDLLIDAKKWTEATAAIAAARADIAQLDAKRVRASWTATLDAQAAKIAEKSRS